MNLLDRIIGYVSPAAGARRLHARATMQQVQALVGSGKGAYNAASVNRLNSLRMTSLKENEVSGDEHERLRADSWDLYRNNHSARKIVRSLESKVVGRGIRPEPMANTEDGEPHVEFRARATKLWESIQNGFDARGLPGQGGLTMSGLQKLALRSTMLSGDSLYRFRTILEEQRKKRDIPITVTLQMVDACRLANESEVPAGMLAEGHTVFRGVELNADGERVALWIRNVPAWAGLSAVGDPVRIEVDKIGHLFIEEDIDQQRGTPWFSSAILRARRTDDLEHNVLTATAMAACVIGTYSKPTGAKKLGLNPIEGSGAEGDETIEGIQPGMVVNTGKEGSFQLQSPNQPNMNPEGFVGHLQRGTATALPGTKSSTVTGDYRDSSFSSERSADNDIWPEIQDIQDWFAASFCQPTWETVLRSAVTNGYFDDIVSAAEFQADPGRFSAANWQGPIALSINPKDDADAATKRIKGFLSSLQMECAKTNVSWRDVLNDAAEVYAVAAEKKIPPEVVNNIMGIEPSDESTPAPQDGQESEIETEEAEGVTT